MDHSGDGEVVKWCASKKGFKFEGMQQVAMPVFSLLDSPWEPSLLEQIGMDSEITTCMKETARIKYKETKN